jgi:hypothetical protein
MPSEKRTRVEIFLPVRSDSAEYRIITDWLAEELAYARGGSTLTTPFTGLYQIRERKPLDSSMGMNFAPPKSPRRG